MQEDLLKVEYFERRKVDYIAYETEEEVLRAFIELFLFSIFLIVTTILALNSHNIYGFHSNESVRRLLVEKFMQKKFIWEITGITNLETWWKYLKYDYLGKFNNILRFPNRTSDKETDPLGLHSKPFFWDVNILLHSPRMRQIRIKPKKCDKHHFVERTQTCYGKYSPSVQSSEPFHKGTKYTDIKNSDIRSVWATINVYSGGGYFIKIPSNETDLVLKSLQDTQWIDRGTRLVELTMETLNYNLGTFSIIKLITEVMPTGNVVCAFYTSVLPLESIWSLNNPSMVTTACIFYIIATFNMGHEIYEIILFGIRNYLKVVWNYIDWSVIITVYISLGFSIAYPFKIDKYLRDIENENELASLDTIEFYDIIYKASICLCTVQLWIRIFRFINYNTTMLHFSMALRRCAPEILWFVIILIISLTIFAIVGLLVFGTKHPDFANFLDSFFFMFRLMLHDFDYHYFSNVEPFWAPIYLMCYVLIVIFILGNMFLAIISQTYIDVKHDTKERFAIAIKSVFVYFYRQIKKFWKSTMQKVGMKKLVRNLGTESVEKKILFFEDLNKPEIPTDSEESSQKEIGENNKPKKGLRESASIVSLASSHYFYNLEKDEETDDPNPVSTDFLVSRLDERLDLLETKFKQLDKDADVFLARLETRVRRNTIKPHL